MCYRPHQFDVPKSACHFSVALKSLQMCQSENTINNKPLEQQKTILKVTWQAHIQNHNGCPYIMQLSSLVIMHSLNNYLIEHSFFV